MYFDTGYTYPKNPTFGNTDREYYNCGGYALGTYRWYLPAKDDEEHERFERMLRNGQVEKVTTLSMLNMIYEFNLRVISNQAMLNRTIDYKKYEVIAFRYEKKGTHDFHFMKLGRNGIWYEKRGWVTKIYCHAYNYIFQTWNNRYDGPIIFMIRKRER